METIFLFYKSSHAYSYHLACIVLLVVQLDSLQQFSFTAMVKLATAKKSLPNARIANGFHGVALNVKIRQQFLGNGKKPLRKVIISNAFHCIVYYFWFYATHFWQRLETVA